MKNVIAVVDDVVIVVVDAIVDDVVVVVHLAKRKYFAGSQSQNTTGSDRNEKQLFRRNIPGQMYFCLEAGFGNILFYPFPLSVEFRGTLTFN